MLEKRIETINKAIKEEQPVSKVKNLFENYLIAYMKLKDEKGVIPTAQDLNNYSKLFHDYLEYCNKKRAQN